MNRITKEKYLKVYKNIKNQVFYILLINNNRCVKINKMIKIRIKIQILLLIHLIYKLVLI